MSRHFVNSSHKAVHVSRLMSHSDSPFAHTLDRNLPLALDRAQYSKRARTHVHVHVHVHVRVQMQAHVDTHMQDSKADIHIRTPTRSITQSDKRDQSPIDFLSEKFVNRFQGSVIHLLSVCHGFTIN